MDSRQSELMKLNVFLRRPVLLMRGEIPSLLEKKLKNYQPLVEIKTRKITRQLILQQVALKLFTL